MFLCFNSLIKITSRIQDENHITFHLTKCLKHTPICTCTSSRVPPFLFSPELLFSLVHIPARNSHILTKKCFSLDLTFSSVLPYIKLPERDGCIHSLFFLSVILSRSCLKQTFVSIAALEKHPLKGMANKDLLVPDLNLSAALAMAGPSHPLTAFPYLVSRTPHSPSLSLSSLTSLSPSWVLFFFSLFCWLFLFQIAKCPSSPRLFLYYIP